MMKKDMFLGMHRWVKVCIGMLACAVIAYYIGEAWMVVMGQPLTYVSNPYHLLFYVLFFMICSTVGLIFKRILIVSVIFAFAAAGLMILASLNGTGPALGWIRNIVANLIWPLANGIIFYKYMSKLDELEH
jgi:hypothetical protein